MDRTNVTSSGYTFNGQNFTNETRTDSQGNNYTVAVPSTISTATLSTPTTLPVTQPQYNTSGQQSLASQAGAYVNGALTSAEQSLKAEQDALKASQTDVGRLLTDAGNKGTDIASQYNQQDATGQSVNSLAAKLRQLSARSNALSIDNLAKSQREINNATGQNITQSAVTRNTADATRENLINQASIAMEAAIVNADYQSAKSYADQMVDAKYDKLEADTKAALFNLENNKERFTAAEKKVAEATAARLKKEEKDLEEKKANEKAVSDMVTNARVQGVDPSLADRASKAKNPSEAAAILGRYAGDYLSVQIKKAQLAKLGLENQEAYNKLYSTSPSGLRSLSYEENAKFNSTPEAKAVKDATAYAKAVADYKAAIEKYGTGELFGTGSGALGQTYSALVGATKDYYTLGTLDNGVQKLIALGIPEPGVLGLKKGRIDALDTALTAASDTIKRNTDQLLATNYKNTNELRQLTDNANSVLMYRLSNQDLLNSIPGASAGTVTSNSTNSDFFNK